ncbi:uncharacterized protein LOC132610497 [Lycium barbarum]|uniref:uncharacterized protein LOC132610497 n=1 Tax=Lycium barbarum TaxID=112863 RepID=UPI00293E0A65|nr:uncharacterized protein LOC132610497 [Lycium barbarum]
MSVLAEKSPSKMLGKRSHTPFKRVKVDAIRYFPKNCGPFVRQGNGSRIQRYADSETKRVKVDNTRNFLEKCGPQMKNGSGTQCSACVEIKSCSEVAKNVIESAKPLSVSAPSKEKDIQIDLPPIPRQAKRDNLVAKEVGDSSHLRTSCQSTKGNKALKMKEKNLMHDGSTQQHEVLVNHRLKVPKKPSIYRGSRCDWFTNGGRTKNANHSLKVPKKPTIYTGNRCDWFMNGGLIENGSELPVVSGHGLLIESEYIQKVKEVRETFKLFNDLYTKCYYLYCKNVETVTNNF